MPPVGSSSSSQRLRPGTTDAFQRAVREACEEACEKACEAANGLSATSAASVGARATEPSWVRSAERDQSMRLACPTLFEHLEHLEQFERSAARGLTAPDLHCLASVNIVNRDMAAAAAGQSRETGRVTRPSPEELSYCGWLAAQMSVAASARKRASLAEKGPAGTALKPGMCREVRAADLCKGIELGELHGDPFSTYEFVLRFPAETHHLCVWTSQRHGEFNVLLECDPPGRMEYSASQLFPDRSQSQIFKISWRAAEGTGARTIIARLEGTGSHFAGVRLYLQAV
jgi:hypothetical protein